MPSWPGYLAVFLLGALAGAGLLFLVDPSSDGDPPRTACNFPPYSSDAVERAPAASSGPGAELPSAQARTVLAESVVELHVRVCFENGATLETGGTGILITSGPPWRVLTANHNVEARQWGAVRDIEIEVRRRGALSSGAASARVVKADADADIAELALELPDGMVWQSATPPAALRGMTGGTLFFLCYFELEIRRGVLVQEITRADGVPTYELLVPAGPGCSGAGVVNQAGQLVGIVVQANQDVTRVSSVSALE